MGTTRSSSNDVALRRRVVGIFFLGLLALAGAAVALVWAWERLVGWGVFRLGWVNGLAGAAMVLAGSALVIWSVTIQFRRGLGTPAPAVATQKLVTQGPYAYTRNPMTLGALILYLGIGVWMGSAMLLLLVAIVFGVLLSYIYVHETTELTQRFGEDYLSYKKRTPFLIPRFKSKQG
jgi:protein-S-isoprenylcysteine O-methyltransferase Ste14